MSWRIRTVSERTGVNAETLRSWERRYGLVQPERSEGGYRVYSEDDIAVISRVKGLVDSGLAISEALAQARREGLVPAEPRPKPRRSPRAAAPQPAPGGAIGAARTALVDALLDVDRHRADALVASLPPMSLPRFARDVLLPAARRVGELFGLGSATLVQERFAVAWVRERLGAILVQQGGGPPGGPEAVCAGAPGDRQELGQLGSAIHLAGLGWRVTVLGADVDPGELGTFLEKRRPGLLLVTVGEARAEADRRHLLRRVRMLAPATTPVVVAGRGARGAGTRVEGVAVARSFDDLPSPTP